MKTKLLLLLALFLAASLRAADDTTDLQQGLFEEEANQNFAAAIKAYSSVVARQDEQRRLAATALFRLGECYRKLGRTNEAVLHYERVLRDFSDQTNLVAISRQHRRSLGVLAETSSPSGLSPKAQAEQRRLFEEEIKLVQSELETMQAQVKSGLVSSGALVPKQRELLGLRRQLAALAEDGGGTAAPSNTAATDEEEQEVRRIKAIIQDSPDLINARRANEGTPLQIAARKGQLVVARFLLENKAEVNAPASGGSPPLVSAAQAGHKRMVELLLDHGANIDARDPSASGKTALQLAVDKDFRAVFETLIARKADVNVADDYGGTALHLAVEKGRLPFAQLLLDHGAQVNGVRKPKRGDIPRPDSYASTRSYYGTPLHLAVEHGNTALIKLLLARGADVTIPNWLGESPLHVAAQSFPTEPAVLLLAAKADVNAAVREGEFQSWTPLHYAAKSSEWPMVKVLLEHGANPNARLTVEHPIGGNTNEKEVTPLLLAAIQIYKKESTDIIKALLEGKADPNLKTSGGRTALHFAMNSPNAGAIEALLKHGADVEAQTPEGDTALVRAVRQGNKEFVQLLLAARADPNARGLDGLTPLHRAVGGIQKDLLALLLAAKADPNATDRQGRTPLDYVKNGINPGSSRPGVIPARFPGPANSAEPALTPLQTEMASALRSSGAAEWAPRADQLTLTRRSRNTVLVHFTRGTNTFNRFSLYELLAAERFNSRDTKFPFPDFSKVTITRRDPATGKISDTTVDVAAKVATGDCKQDMWLEWGDLVDIPEKEHPLNVKWMGLDEGFAKNLARCLDRTVTLTVKGQSKTNLLYIKAAHLDTVGDDAGNLNVNTNFYVWVPRFWLHPYLHSSGQLLTSSDLTRVQVRRADGGSGRTNIWEIDVRPGQPEQVLWLRDGDEIEVPELPPGARATVAEPQVPRAVPPVPIGAPVP